ncbi:MAG: LamG-like jellyroll fold domain-containing protein [Ignavibacteriaceae bacterium]
MKSFLRSVSVLSVLMSIFLIASLTYAQAQIGGPYTPDSNTVLLLHFSGNFKDSAGVCRDGQPQGKISFITNTDMPEFGQSAFFNNDARSDSSFLVIPDTSALSLQGDWTLEGWVNFLSFGETTDSWNWRPMLIVKEWNYICELIGLPGTHYIAPSYRAQDNTLVRITGTVGSVNPGSWYHWTYIRDTTNSIIILLVNDQNRRLIDFRVEPFDPAVPTAMKTNYPVQIGNWPENLGGGFINGLVDEIRISNVIRKFPMPPIIKKGDQEGAEESITHALPNQNIPVNVDVINYTGTITDVTLHYSINHGNFQSVSMILYNSDQNRNRYTYTYSLPPQSLGTEIRYYLTASNSNGYQVTTQNSPFSDSSYFGIAVWQPNSLVLGLNFENGSGVPVDSSQYHQKIVEHGNPIYSTDAISGKYSMYFEGDSSYLEIKQPAPFMVSNSMTIDYWFKADTLFGGEPLLGKYPEYAWDVWQFGYRNWIRDNQGHFGPETYFETPNAVDQRWTMIDMPNALSQHIWYHLVEKISSESGIAIAEIYDSTGNLIVSGSANINNNGFIKPRAGAFRIGADYSWSAKFKGYIDDLKIYNYAANMPPKVTKLYQPDAVQQLPNQSVNIKADIQNAKTAVLHYSTGGNYTDLPMTLQSGITFETTIPGQPLGTVIKYNITAVNENGATVKTPSTGPDFGIGYSLPNTETLHLTFEEGSGTPIDSSQYHNPIVVFGNPTYSTNAKEGKYSLYLEGDSSYLQINAPAPILASPQVTVDFWFEADSLPASATDLLGIFPARGNAWAFGYRVWFQDKGLLYPEFYFVSSTGGPDQRWTNTPLKYNITTNKWYRIQVQASTDTMISKLWDDSGNLVAQAGVSVGMDQILNPVGGIMTIGRSQFSNMPLFKGRIDDIKIYNYAMSSPTGIKNNGNSITPSTYSLSQNYPNPFNPTTSISFSVPNQQNVEIVIYNVLGEKVKTLVNKVISAGFHTIQWDGKNEMGSYIASGIYFYRMVANNFHQVHKMIMLK